VNPAHQFVDTLSKCPWCEIEAATGVPLFQVAVVEQNVNAGRCSPAGEPRNLPPSDNRADVRSVTPLGFARRSIPAIFSQWGDCCKN
jgi:hypothetical protein